MAQDAELKLKVSLDLAFFRQQLSTVGAQLGGQSLQLNVQFNKKSIADQYRLLDRYVRGKKFNVELNLIGGLTKNEFEKIKGRLDDLRDLRKVEIPIGIKNGATGKDVDKVVSSIKERIGNNQQIKQGGGKLRIEASIKPSVTNQDIADLKKAAKDKLSKIGALEIATKLEIPKVEDPLKALQKNLNRQKPLLVKTSIKPSILRADVQAFKKAVEEKLSGITVKINAELATVGGGKTKAQIEKEVLAGLERIQQMGAERMGGGVTEAARRESLRQSLQGRDIEELRGIGAQLGVSGVGRFRNAQNLIEKIVAESSIEMITKYLDPQAVMRNPDRSGLNKVLDTFARGLFNMLGMDVASMRQQVAQRRALPGINFPATIPSRAVSIGPSATGRALPAGRAAAGMIGAAQAPVGLLPSITRRSSIQAGIENIFAAGGPRFPEGVPGKLALSTEALQERVNAQLAEYFKVVEAKVREVFNPQDLKRALNIFSYLPQALRDAEARTRQARVGIPSAQGIAGLLPAAQGRAPSTYSTGAIGGESREQMMARRTAEAYARSALRGMDVMGGGAGRPPAPYSYAYRSARPTSAIVPYAAGGAMVPSPVAAGVGGTTAPRGGGGGFGGLGGFGGFGRALGSVNLPGAGTIRELGSEFAFATKQVLLFGQAYKLLGFLQSFPGQVGAAVGQLQSFRNTLNAISPSAEEAAASNRLILDLVDRYNVPLQSAREGFTKLYASMAPAGFSGNEIRDLFTGITQAAATFGMSADKVDRVNYAFAQMASKGQVMSEELKGQLGDVLPGAMALFAQAAGFEGPKAIQDFSAALEDGAYKGEAMVALLKNVGIVMKQEFGPGAEGAALTFQGIVNRMQNSMTLLYESFEPVAVSFLNAVVVPLTSGIQQISDGFTAFFTGMTAQTTGGFAIAQELERLRPTFDGLRGNLSGLTEQFGQFARIALDVGKVFLQIASSPIFGYLAKLYAIALPINMALNVMRGLWAANALQLVIFNARVAAGTGTLTAFRGMMAATGATAQSTAASIRATGTVLRTFFAATGVGVVITGISMLIERIMMLNQKMDETRQKAAGAANAIRMMSGTEALAAERSYAGYAKSLEGLNKQLQEGQLQGKAWIAVNRQQAEALKAAGVIPSEVRGQAQVQPTRISGAYQKLVQMQGEAAYRRRQLDFEAKQIEQSAVLAPIPEATGGDAKEKSKKGARRSLAELVSAEVLMLADAEKAAIKYAEAQSRAMAPDTAQAQRMLDYYSKFRNNLVDMQAIQAQIAIAEKNRSRWISEYGMTAEQIDGNIKELRNQLKIATIDLATTEQEYRNQAKKDAAEEAEEIQKKIEKQKELNRLIKDAQIAAGIIPPQQAAIIQQRRGFEDAVTRAKEAGAGPEQLAQLTAAQALIPEAGSLQETIKTLREELDKLTSSQELVKASALSIGDAFSKSFKDAITGASSAQEALAGFFQSVASSFADMAAQMIQKMIQIYILDQFLKILPGAGSFAGGAKIGQSVGMPTGVGIGAGGGILQNAGGQGFGTFGPNFGIRQFANGGLVTGPTMGLIGEGRYNEAVVPLPDGKSIPVDLGGASSGSAVNVVVNVDAKGTDVQGSDQRGNALGRVISSAVQQELIKQQRPGGLLAGRR